MNVSHLMLLAVIGSSVSAFAGEPRARDLGIPFDGNPGPLNAITDVAGVTVGHATVIADLPDGRAARTGVTAVLPRGWDSLHTLVYAGWTALNGNGEMTGTTWVSESGFLEGPVMITNTHSVGAVHEGTIRWRVAQDGADATGFYWSLPVVAETWDGWLNDINGFHVRPSHAGQALDAATGGPVAEGGVGGGTGMICFELKCGIGTASRAVTVDGSAYRLGVLVQANFGVRGELRVAGVPVGPSMPGVPVYTDDEPPDGNSSIIAVVATDAPLLPHQLDRIARRVSLGIARTGGIAHNGSGDIFIAFSTANEGAGRSEAGAGIRSLPNHTLDPLFEATVQATEEAVINALVAGRDVTGDLGHAVSGIDRERLRALLEKYVRLAR